jgi:hypothetical protein
MQLLMAGVSSFQMSSPALKQDIFPFILQELHLMGNHFPVWLTEFQVSFEHSGLNIKCKKWWAINRGHLSALNKGNKYLEQTHTCLSTNSRECGGSHKSMPA